MNLGLMRELSPDDVIDIAKLLPLAEKAEEYEQLIISKYDYIKEGEFVKVYHKTVECGSYGYPEVEYIAKINGKLRWIAERYHISYDLTISKVAIFELLKSTYFLEEGYPYYEKDGKTITDEGATSIVHSYFEDFVSFVKA